MSIPQVITKFTTHIASSTSWSSSRQLHSYKSRQLSWLAYISRPSSANESDPSLPPPRSHTALNLSTRSASLNTCSARACRRNFSTTANTPTATSWLPVSWGWLHLVACTNEHMYVKTDGQPEFTDKSANDSCHKRVLNLTSWFIFPYCQNLPV